MADNREFMHGANLLNVDGNILATFSSNNYPPTSPSGNWNHDAYYSWIDPENPELNVETLYGGDEAQEPVSTAVNSNGVILATSEDGSNGINQYAGLFSSDLEAIVPYPDINIRDGGHSGHATAVGEDFLVTYSEGWVDGGGVDNLGTGADVWARFVSETGETGPEIEIATGRNWWPVTASSDEEAIVVWQKYEGDDSLPSLQSSIVSSSGNVESQTEIMPATEYYNYDVQFVDELNQYLVIGLGEDGTYASLVNKDGEVTDTATGIAAESVREAGFAVNGTTAVYATNPSGLAVLDLEGGKIELRDTIDGDVTWDYTGTDGIFTDDSNVLFAGNTTEGLQLMLAEVFSEGGGAAPEDWGGETFEPWAAQEPAEQWATWA